MATTLATLRQRLLESISDFIEVEVTTAIAAGTSVVSTNLKEYDGGADDYFNGRYVYIKDYKNAGVERQVSDYVSSTGTLTVRGANLTSDGTDKATIWVCRHSVLQRVDKAINRAIEEIYPALHRSIDDLSLVTGNALPDGSFEWWTSSSALKWYSTSNATLEQTTALYRGQRGSMSMKVTASAADGYAYISSNTYPRLLDLMNTEVDLYAWAYPSADDDAFLTIYTLKVDGSTQTINSTTTCPASKWTLLEIENQAINDEIVEVQIRFRVHTNGENAYFDDAILGGRGLYEYLLPYNLQNGGVDQVYVQTENYAELAPYDLHPEDYRQAPFLIIDDDTYSYLRLRELPLSYRRLRLIGVSPLESLSSATDTITLDEGGRTDLLIAYASYLLYEMTESPVSSEDTSRYERESAKRYNKYLRLLRRHRMGTPAGRLRV